MRVFFCLLFLVPGSLSSCSEPVTGPKEVVAALGSCLYISCRYDLCQAGPDPQLRNLTWIQSPDYDKERQEFMGRKVAEIRGTPGANEGDCALVLPRVRAGDAGRYGLRLVADPKRRNSNKELRWMHYVTVNVTDTAPAPHLWLDPGPLTQGRRTTVGCWVPPACPQEAPTLKWEGPVTKTAGVQVVDWTPPADVTPFPAVGTLLDFKTQWYHDGTVLSCVLRGSDGKTIAQVSQLLQVNYPPRDVLVEMTPSSPVHEGWEVTLRCHDSAKPPSHAYAWSLGGHVLPHGAAQFRLQPARAADGGSYACRATNAVGTTESLPVTLEVYYPPRDVRVEATPPSPVHEGGEMTLSCRFSSNPPPRTYAWSLEGRSLPHSAAQLPLRPISTADGGSYSCRVTNDLGTASSLATALEVYYPPRSAILESLTPLPALIGSRVALRCALGPAHPAPTAVQWLRDDSWQADTPGPALAFDADPARAGAYRCLGRNPAGSALSPPLSVVVWYPPKSVRVLQSPGGPVTAGRGPVRLQCQIGAGVPPQFAVSWWKDGRELPSPAPDLLLPGPRPEDAAAYACHARNAAGVARSAPHALDVRYGPRAIELVPEPGARVQEQREVTLRCRADAHPPPAAFEWFRDGRALGRSPKGFWELGAVGSEESGRYRCRVVNAVASGESPDVTLTVYYSTTTILRRTFLGLGVGLGVLLLLGTLGCFLRRRWWRQMAADEEPVVEPSGTFFLRNKKGRAPGSPRPPGGPADAVSYASLLSPPGSGAVPRMRGDAVVYTVLQRNEGAAKATEGSDYENVPPGPGHRDGDRDGTLVYAALALSSSGTPVGQGGDTVEYVTLKH
ncbi:B-cell receptor CD22 [Chlamydotis macqueenii]